MTAVSPSEAPAARCLPKLCGGDLELGNSILGLERTHGSGFEASRRLLREVPGYPGDALGAWWASGNQPSGSACAPGGTNALAADWGFTSQDWGRRFLVNGGSAYVDLNHLEVCLPEVLSAYDHVAYTHALYRLAHRAAVAANARLAAGQRLVVLANNSDGQDHSYGSHLNVLITRAAWENLLHRRVQFLAFLVAYQVSSIIFTGQGKVGAENGAPPAAFQLAQRADFFEVVTGEQTTAHRPLVNARDEPLTGNWRASRLADPAAEQMARLHVIFYDHNLCHVAGFLKVGCLQLILALIEAECLDPELFLDDPLDAVIGWSHDPRLRVKAKLVSGRLISAVDLQWRFHELAREFVAQGRCEGLVPDAEEIVQLWGDTLERLGRDDLGALAPRLDWVLKLSLLHQAMRQRPELRWDSPELRHLDAQYANLDPAEGGYFRYEQAGFVQRLVPETHLERATREPPEQTRAYTRAALLRLAAPEEVDAVDWDYIRFRLRAPGAWLGSCYRTVSLANPLLWHKTHAAHVLPADGTLEEALDALGVRATDTPYGSPGSGDSAAASQQLLLGNERTFTPAAPGPFAATPRAPQAG